MTEQGELDALYTQLLDRAGGDLELLARTAVAQLVEQCVKRGIAEAKLDAIRRANATEVSTAAKLAMINTILEPDNLHVLPGRPVTIPWRGLYVPQKRRTRRDRAGAPQKYSFPRPTKFHAIDAYQRELKRLGPDGGKFNARFAALVELLVIGINPNHPEFEGALRALQGAIRKIKMSVDN